jgi:hypothetical protein
MKSNFIDEKIKMEICDSCHMIEVSDDLKLKIDNQINEQSKKEIYRMKKLNKKKVVIVAFAACLFVSANVFAAGKISSLVSGTNAMDIVKDFSKLEQQEKKLGYDVKALECFDNGYLFSKMSVDVTKALDESGNQVGSYKELDITYKNADKNISLIIDKPLPSEETQTPTETRQINDITFKYNLDTYKIVPEDYQMTEEDTANEAKGHYYFSCDGSDKVSTQMVSSLTWEDGGVKYSLLQTDNELTMDELIDMATQVVESK